MQTGRVSVVIPLYNHARYIAEAVASVLDQGELLRELIVIDDGSRDASAEVMAGLAAGDARIRFLTQENRGAHATINRGLALATGEFVTILNSDDAYLPGRFAALVRALDLDPGSEDRPQEFPHGSPDVSAMGSSSRRKSVLTTMRQPT